MTNYEKLKELEKESTTIRNERDYIKQTYSNGRLTHQEFAKLIDEVENKQRFNNIKYNIVKNNLYLDCHNSLMKIYKEVFKKFENKPIGEKRKNEIETIFRKQIENIFNYSEDVPYYNRFYLYFHLKDYTNERVFEISIDKLRYDFAYNLENEEVKNYYNLELPQNIENVEEEATRLLNIYNKAVAKKEEIQKELEEVKEEIDNNFKRNLYSDEISRLNRILTLHWY